MQATGRHRGQVRNLLLGGWGLVTMQGQEPAQEPVQSLEPRALDDDSVANGSEIAEESTGPARVQNVGRIAFVAVLLVLDILALLPLLPLGEGYATFWGGLPLWMSTPIIALGILVVTVVMSFITGHWRLLLGAFLGVVAALPIVATVAAVGAIGLSTASILVAAPLWIINIGLGWAGLGTEGPG